MVRVLYWGEGGSAEEAGFDPARVASRCKAPGGAVWVDVEGPETEELEAVGRAFGLHPLNLEDAAHYSELPKVDEFPDHAFIVVHGVEYREEADALELPELDVFFGRDFLVTVHRRPMAAVSGAWGRYRQGLPPGAAAVEFVLHSVLDALVDGFFPVIQFWEHDLLRLEDDVLRGRTRGVLEEAQLIRRNLLWLRRSLGPQRQVYDLLSRAGFPFTSAATSLYFRDVYDHVARLFETVELDREILNTVLQAHLSLASDRINRVIQRLTVVATVFLPLTFITGVYGMNFRFMPELQLRWGYPAVWAAMVLLGLGMLAFFRHRGWLAPGAGEEGSGRVGTPAEPGETGATALRRAGGSPGEGAGVGRRRGSGSRVARPWRLAGPATRRGPPRPALRSEPEERCLTALSHLVKRCRALLLFCASVVATAGIPG
ncbi:MAG: magnesium/cobalt transporter CorA [Acetobacteraceae bacterium]|nr:magnesium/cobalt transporter CorA [Acetobacteraceae bacterium]